MCSSSYHVSHMIPTKLENTGILSKLSWFQGSASSFVYCFCHCMSLHVYPGEIFILDSHLANFWERNCPFGFLLVVFFVVLLL